MEKKLAKIKSASLEIKEIGVLSFWIHVDYEDGMSQGIGGIGLDNYSKVDKKRVGTAYGCEMIRRILIELNVNDFSEMKGRKIWIHGVGHGFSFNVKGFSALKVDNSKSSPVIFDEILEQFKDEVNGEND